MKWLGQHIIDIVARFRSLIYLEGVENLGSASDRLLSLDSDNKVVFRTKAETADDLAVITSLKFILNNPLEQPAVTSGDAIFSLTGSNGISTQTAGGSSSINIIAVPGQIDHDSLFGYNASQHIDWTAENAGTIHASNYSGGFTAGDGLTLTGSDLDLDASLTTVTSILNASLKIGRDADNLIDFATTDDQFVFRVAGVDKLRLTGNELRPNLNNGLSLGSQYRMWSDLFLADGSVINFNNGDVTLTHAANALTMAGGAMTFSGGIADSGTISDGTWQGGVIASAYLDSDTAHLSGTQTFSGTKTFSNTISGSISGNAATATALTSGDKTINGDLTVTSGTSGEATLTIISDTDNNDENDNPFLVFTQDGGAINGYMGLTGDADKWPDGGTLTGATPNALVLGTKGPTSSTNSQLFLTAGDAIRLTILNDGKVGIGTTTPSKALEVSGDIDLTGLVRPGLTYIKILPSDFIPDDVGRPVQINDSSSSRFLVSHSTAKMYASVDIPQGFKATAVDVYGSGTSNMTVYEANINNSSPTSLGNGSIGTTFTISSGLQSNDTNYLLIELSQTSLEKVYGGKVTISKI